MYIERLRKSNLVQLAAPSGSYVIHVVIARLGVLYLIYSHSPLGSAQGRVTVNQIQCE